MIIECEKIRKGGFAPFLLAVLLTCLAGCTTAVRADESKSTGPARVLFVGNSFTYYNNSLHNHYRRLVASAGVSSTDSRARILTISGGRLPEQARGLQQRLDEEDWDVVIMQGHSLGPIRDETSEAFQASARDYAKRVRDDGAEPVFFMTWAYTGKPEMTAELDKAYTDIGRELGARVVPVGLAFAAVTTERPELSLRIADARHPTLAGTYLAACMFFAILHERSPEGIEYSAGLDANDASYLQRVAWRVANEYQARSE
jgi:Domain of unknown function (DUF4886)